MKFSLLVPRVFQSLFVVREDTSLRLFGFVVIAVASIVFVDCAAFAANEGQLCTFSAQASSSTCPRALRHRTKAISNYVLISEDIEEQTVALTFQGKFASAGALTLALKKHGMFGVGSLTAKNFSLKQNKRAKFFVGSLQCKALMNFRTVPQLEEGPLVPIVATIQYRCPDIRCATQYDGIIDTEPESPES